MEVTTELILTRGLPASGKTSFAKEWVARERGSRVRVNRDDLRGMIHDGEFERGVTEERIIAARNALVGDALRRGVSVVVDDTNLRHRDATFAQQLAARYGAELHVVDYTAAVSLEECLRRNANRGDDERVDSAVIKDMHNRFLRNRTLPLAVPELKQPSEEPVERDATLPPAIIVDVDGTIAYNDGHRSPYDFSRVSEDKVNADVRNLINREWETGAQVIFLSGRDDSCREATAEWLGDNVTPALFELVMRETGDRRPDWLVKLELFNEYVRGEYDVSYVLDDRQQVVDMWRRLGLTCLQVADHQF